MHLNATFPDKLLHPLNHGDFSLLFILNPLFLCLLRLHAQLVPLALFLGSVFDLLLLRIIILCVRFELFNYCKQPILHFFEQH